MSPAGPQGIVAKGKKAASPAADAAGCEKILNRSHPAMGSADVSFPQLVAPSLASPQCRASPVYPDPVTSSCGAQLWAASNPSFTGTQLLAYLLLLPGVSREFLYIGPCHASISQILRNHIFFPPELLSQRNRKKI